MSPSTTATAVTESPDPHTPSPRELITGEIARYHAHLRQTLPALRTQAARVATIHGEREPELLSVGILVDKLAEILLADLDEEERTLFPALLAEPAPPRISESLECMETSHAEIVARLAELRGVAEDYLPPAWAGATYRTLMQDLARFEADTLRHLDLESRVLASRFVDPG